MDPICTSRGRRRRSRWISRNCWGCRPLQHVILAPSWDWVRRGLGAAGTVFRQRFAIRLVTQIVRRLARAAGVTRLAVRTRTGQSVNELVVAYPWRNSGRAETLAYGLAQVLDGAAAGPDAISAMISAEGLSLPRHRLAGLRG